MNAKRDVVILGIGNVLLRDDGVGVHVARALAEAAPSNRLPPATNIVDGGTLGLDLLPIISEAQALLMIDAVDFDLPPGTVTVLRDAELLQPLGRHMSSHQVGVSDMLAIGRLTGALPKRVALVGIQPDTVEVGLDLSPTAARAVPTAVAVACAEARSLAECQDA